MRTKARLLVLFIATALFAFGSTTITFTGPSLPVIGDPLQFKVFSVSITQPMAGNTWTVTIQTNYGATLPNPANPSIIPPFQFGNGQFYTIGDFLIQWKGNDYGLALTDHDTFVHGDLYQVNSYLSSVDILGSLAPRQEYPGGGPAWVQLAPPGTLLGTGTITTAKTGDGVNTALYTITDQFTAPANFLSNDVFQVIFSSYVCANGVILGQGAFGVPEPGTFALTLPALLAFGFFARRVRARKLQ